MKKQKILYRIQKENIEKPRSEVIARMLASNIDQTKINVKILVKITDESFFCKGVKLWFSASAENYKPIMMEEISEGIFGIVLANIPENTTVLYYIELLDKSGLWLKRFRHENTQEPFEFYVTKSGVKEVADWDVEGLVRCRVCDYMCQPSWDICPGCKTPLHDEELIPSMFEEKKDSENKKITDQIDYF